MAEVNLGVERSESLVVPRTTVAMHTSEISQASEGLQLKSTAATLEYMRAWLARLETRLVEHERRAAATLPPLQPEPDPPDGPPLYAAAQPQLQSTSHQPLYADHGCGTPMSATTTRYQIAWTGYQQNCPPPHAASSPWPPNPAVPTPPYQTERYQQPLTYQPSQPVQPRRATSWDPPTCWETPGQRTFLENSAYYQLPYYSNPLPQNSYVGYHPGQPEYLPTKPPYPPLQSLPHLDRSLQQPSLAQPDAAFGPPPYVASDTYTPSSYVLLKNSSWDVLECAKKENLMVDFDRVEEGFDDSTEKILHSSSLFCGVDKIDIDGNLEAREDDVAKETKTVEEEEEKEEDFRAGGKMVDEEFCCEIELIPGSHSSSFNQETAAHQTMENNDSLNGMGSFLDEIGDSKSSLLDDNHENKATFDDDEFIEIEPQSVKLSDDSDVDLYFGEQCNHLERDSVNVSFERGGVVKKIQSNAVILESLSVIAFDPGGEISKLLLSSTPSVVSWFPP